jgi:sugar O-acyltransferase (sialic acid O-acetyltransferase NeuD family)
VIPIVVVGAGGHASACIDVIEAAGTFKIARLVDPLFEPGTQKNGYTVAGGDETLTGLRLEYSTAFVAIGQVKSSTTRRTVSNLLTNLGYNLPSIVSPIAHLSPSSKIGPGVIAMHGVIVGPGVEIGALSIINSQALIEHGCRIGEFVHISTGAIVNGDCEVGDDCFVGSGAVIHQGVRVGARTIVAAGAVVKSDLPSDHIHRG